MSRLSKTLRTMRDAAPMSDWNDAAFRVPDGIPVSPAMELARKVRDFRSNCGTDAELALAVAEWSAANTWHRDRPCDDREEQEAGARAGRGQYLMACGRLGWEPAKSFLDNGGLDAAVALTQDADKAEAIRQAWRDAGRPGLAEALPGILSRLLAERRFQAEQGAHDA